MFLIFLYQYINLKNIKIKLNFFFQNYIWNIKKKKTKAILEIKFSICYFGFFFTQDTSLGQKQFSTW